MILHEFRYILFTIYGIQIINQKFYNAITFDGNKISDCVLGTSITFELKQILTLFIPDFLGLLKTKGEVG